MGGKKPKQYVSLLRLLFLRHTFLLIPTPSFLVWPRG